MKTQKNLDRFYDQLTNEYESLFSEDPDYQYAISIGQTASGLARKMTLGLDNGTASKAGKGIKATCKELGIPHTYKAIRTFLGS